jgi:hypothetical protein
MIMAATDRAGRGTFACTSLKTAIAGKPALCPGVRPWGRTESQDLCRAW